MDSNLATNTYSEPGSHMALPIIVGNCFLLPHDRLYLTNFYFVHPQGLFIGQKSQKKLNRQFFSRKIMLYNIIALYLHCVFHGIRFKVNGRLVVGVTINFFYTLTRPALHTKFPTVLGAKEGNSIIHLLKKRKNISFFRRQPYTIQKQNCKFAAKI